MIVTLDPTPFTFADGHWPINSLKWQFGTLIDDIFLAKEILLSLLLDNEVSNDFPGHRSSFMCGQHNLISWSAVRTGALIAMGLPLDVDKPEKNDFSWWNGISFSLANVNTVFRIAYVSSMGRYRLNSISPSRTISLISKPPHIFGGDAFDWCWLSDVIKKWQWHLSHTALKQVSYLNRCIVTCFHHVKWLPRTKEKITRSLNN